MADETDLTDFGGGSTRDPPVVRKYKALHISVAGTVKHVGNLAKLVDADPDTMADEKEGPTDGAYVTTRDSETHRLRQLKPDAGGAYAVSRGAVDEVRRMAHRTLSGQLRRFFVHEQDTGAVYEYPFRALEDGAEVPDRFLETTADPQVYVTRDDAAYVWEDHAPDDFYAPRGGGRR